MTTRSFILSSARHYARVHLGLLVGAFLASAILSGSMLVGDSVKASLKRAAMLRLGYVRHALLGGDRWFTERLAQGTGSAPFIMINGSASLPSGKARANGVQVLGVSDAFWNLSPSGKVIALGKDAVAVNEALAARLSLKVGDTLVIRMEQPSTLSRDAPLSGSTKEEVTLRRTVSAVVAPVDFGHFQIAATQRVSDSVYLPLADLQAALDRVGRINVFARSSTGRPVGVHLLNCLCNLCAPPAMKEDAPSMSGRWFNMVLASHTTLEDLALKLTQVQGGVSEWEISTDRIFIDQAFADKLLERVPGSYGVITYLVNGFSSGAGRTPYSMVTAADEKRLAGLLPDVALKPGEVLVNQWLADDLKLAVGSKLDVRYFTVGIGRELSESTAPFTVRGIVPMNHADMKREWTPAFPGVSDADNCRDWNSGLPIKLDAIRDQDEKYWDDYKGTPKAFIGLADGQRIWGNRFGKLTAIRFPNAGEDEAALRVKLGSMLRLSDIGLTPVDLKLSGDAAARGTVDFGGLFIGLSLFLIAAALVFAALLFIFMIERRASQVGLLMALGWTPSQVRRAILCEAGVIALVGSALGLLGGVAYTKAALAGLGGAWGGATAGLELVFAAQPTTLIIAGVASFVVSFATLWWATRRLFKVAPRALLSGSDNSQSAIQNPQSTKPRWRTATTVVIVALLSAIALSLAGGQSRSPEAIAGMFFGAGMMLLISGLALVSLWMKRLAHSQQQARSLWQIGVRNVVRRPGRSLAVIGMMAGGIFLVAAVNAFRLSADEDPTRRDSGTGGFAFVGESSLPIYEDLDSKLGREAFGLDEEDMQGVGLVPMRVRDGDDASCLNLNKAQSPQIVGVDVSRLMKRGAFGFTSGGWDKMKEHPTSKEGEADSTPAASSGSETINPPLPAIADMNTAMWGLGKGVGDTLSYKDSKGNEFTVQIVALLAGSVLQGKIIINEADFVARYPDVAGYRYFLIDAPPARAAEVGATLTRQLEPRGLALEPAKDRFAAFSRVQNTYIGIFTILGGLGVLLGTAGLGVLVARHVLERKGELGLMQALGFRQGALRGMIIGEHTSLLLGGVLLGVLSALLAVWPSLQSASHELPLGFMSVLLVGIAAFGLLVCAAAATMALRGRLLDAVRRE